MNNDSEEEKMRRRDDFQKRIKLQHSMKIIMPIICDQIKKNGRVNTSEVEEDIKKINDLSEIIFKIIEKKQKENLTKKEEKAVLLEIMKIYLEYKKRNINLKIETLTTIFENNDFEDDESDIDWKNITKKGSFALTTSHAAFEIWNMINIYDFRNGKDKTIKKCLEAIQQTSFKAIDQWIGEKITPEEKKALNQSTVRDLTKMLIMIYEEEVRISLKTMIGMTESEKKKYIKERNPLERILEKFTEEAKTFIDFTEMSLIENFEKTITKQ